ncbi:MAG: hypothetical protein H0X25_09680 [Acidobacteriales bacterium]|nr:hypothetical protein [Terriglobales bacterium]
MLFKVALFLTIAIAGFGQAVHYLWNWLMPTLFGVPVVTFWQALGLLALSWVLFGGWRGMRGPSGRGAWRGGIRRRWQQMTPEEREKFRQAMSAKCGTRRPEPAS